MHGEVIAACPVIHPKQIISRSGYNVGFLNIQSRDA